MAIEKIAYDSLDRLVDVKVVSDYLGDSATEEDIMALEKEAAAVTSAISDWGGKLAKSKLGKTISDQAGKVWNSDAVLKMRDYMRQHGRDITNNAVKGAAVGATKGAFSNYKDPEDHKVHRLKNMLHSAAQGAAVGAVGTAVYKGMNYTPSDMPPYNQIKMDLKSMEQTASEALDEMVKEAKKKEKTAFESLETLYTEKQAGLGTFLGAVGGLGGAAKGATKAFKGATGTMTQRLGQAALGGLTNATKGATVGAIGGSLVEGFTNKMNAGQQEQQPNRFQ